MRSGFDFTSKTTGRVHLKSMLDTAPEGLTRDKARLLCRMLRRFQKDLQKHLGPDHRVKLTIDSYEGSVFWYIVLFRPVLFGRTDPVFGSRRTWSVYEIIKAGKGDSLGKTDLGIIHDEDRLLLIWPEARGGILSGMEDCPSWKRIMKGKKHYLSYMKQCADSFSFTIPRWQLKRENLMMNLWQRQGHRLTYFDVTALRLDGIDVPSKVGKLPVARRVKFSWFYDPTQKTRAPIRRKFVDARQQRAARIIYKICLLLKLPRMGRPWVAVSPERAVQLYKKAFANFVPSKTVDWVKVGRELDALQKLGDYEVWEKWRNHGKAEA